MVYWATIWLTFHGKRRVNIPVKWILWDSEAAIPEGPTIPSRPVPPVMDKFHWSCLDDSWCLFFFKTKLQHLEQWNHMIPVQSFQWIFLEVIPVIPVIFPYVFSPNTLLLWCNERKVIQHDPTHSNKQNKPCLTSSIFFARDFSNLPWGFWWFRAWMR